VLSPVFKYGLKPKYKVSSGLFGVNVQHLGANNKVTFAEGANMLFEGARSRLTAL
jgi:hypothetical protein